MLICEYKYVCLLTKMMQKNKNNNNINKNVATFK